MRETRTSGLMSGDGKQGDAKWPEPPRPSSTLPACLHDRLPKRWARLPNALAHRDFGSYLAGVGDCRDGAGSGHVPRVSRSGWLDAAGEAGE